MISKTWSRKSIATAVAVAVLSVYSMVVLAAPGAKASGELSVSGQVTVNGQKVISGGTVFSDSTISTAAQSNASVSISKVGRVELSPKSNLRLSFAGNSITAMLETGSAQVSTLAGTTVNLATKDGIVVVDGSQPTTFTVSALRGRTSVATLSGVAQFKAGGAVNFLISGTHQVLVYGPGTTLDSIARNIVDAAPGPPPFPGFIDDPLNRVYRGLDPRPLPQDRAEAVTFAEKGTYLVVCGLVPHFDEGMHGFVKVV